MNGLAPAATAELDREILNGDREVDLSPHVQVAFDREVDLTPFRSFVALAMDRHRSRPEESDAWLAPRLHYALRMSRREAAMAEVWRYLTLVEVPEYLRWRWGDKGEVAAERATGAEYKQALARLWWGAEQSRNGADYRPTVTLFTRQDIPNNLMRMHLFHNRAMAIAMLRILDTLHHGGPATGRDVNRVSKAVNLLMPTTLLESIAPDPGPDPFTTREWLEGTPDETRYRDDLPPGPQEAPVDPALIARLEAFVRDRIRTLPLDAWKADGAELPSAAPSDGVDIF